MWSGLRCDGDDVTFGDVAVCDRGEGVRLGGVVGRLPLGGVGDGVAEVFGGGVPGEVGVLVFGVGVPDVGLACEGCGGGVPGQVRFRDGVDGEVVTDRGLELARVDRARDRVTLGVDHA